MRKNKIMIISFIAIAIICILSIGYHFLNYAKRNHILYIEYGDSIQDIQTYSLNDEKISLDTKGMCVYFYLSNSCGACMEILDLFEQLTTIDWQNDVSFYCIWEDEIPIKKIEKLAIDNGNMLTLQGKCKLQSVKPYFYIAKNGIIDFSTQNNQELIDKLFTYIDDKEELKKSSFLSFFDEKNISQKALLFVTEHLERESEWEKIEQLNFTEVYTIADFRDEGVYFDKYKLYKKVFEIDLFPSLVFYEDGFILNKTIEDLH